MAVDIQAPYSIRHPDSSKAPQLMVVARHHLLRPLLHPLPYRAPHRLPRPLLHPLPHPHYTQGVGNLWTDPQIHSLAGDDYGDGNLGVGGMALFFSTSRYGPVTLALALALDLDRALTLAPILTLASTSASPNPNPKP